MRERDLRFDVLKGLAILAVLVIHALPPHVRIASYAALHYWQAVPIFFIVFGFNASRSFIRRPPESLRAAYSRTYLVGRLQRLGIPIVATAIASLALGAALHRLSFGPLTLLGVLPMSGPGNYFITLIVLFTLAAPTLLWIVSARPLLALAGAAAVELAFELVAPHIGFSRSEGGAGYLYTACPLRYLTPVVAGMVLARRPGLLERSGWSWLAALAGGAYLVAFTRGAHTPFLPQSGPANVITAGWAVALVVVALRLLPNRPLGPVALLGRASFHIFLVQILFFAISPDWSIRNLALALLVCSPVGAAFFKLEARIYSTQPGPEASSSRMRRLFSSVMPPLTVKPANGYRGRVSRDERSRAR